MLGRLTRYKWYTVVAGLVLLAAAAYMHNRGKPRQVSVAEAELGSLQLRIAASGLVEGSSADLSFESQGAIAEIYVREGEQVSANTLLARIDPVGGGVTSLTGGSGEGDADVITAPYDGTVVEIYQRRGSVVGPGTPVMRTVGTGPRWVTAFIDSDDAAYFRPGQRLECRAGGYLSQPWEIEVRAIGREAVPRRDLPGSSRQVRVRCHPVDAAFSLTPGTEVDVDGRVPMLENGLLIPAAAVVHDGPDDWVWVVDDSAVHRQSVRLGPNNFDLIDIRAGLQPGDTVVVHGKQDLAEGEPVRPEPMPPMQEAATGIEGGGA